MTDGKSYNQEHDKNNTCRILYIKNYRNIAVNGKTHITINRSIEIKKMGGLIFLIGPNNTGKSNVLDAIQSISNGISSRDFPSKELSGNIVMPQISLRTFSEGYKVCESGCKPELAESSISWKSRENTGFRDILVRIMYHLIRENGPFSTRAREFSDLNDRELEFINFLSDKINRFWMEEKGFSKEECDLFETFVSELYQTDVDDPAKFEITYGFKSRPLIIRYKQVQVRGEECHSKLHNYSFFLENIMRHLFGENLPILESLIEKKRDEEEEVALQNFMQDARVKLNDLSDRFNALYHMNEIQYKFNLEISTEGVDFRIYLGDMQQDLEWMSTGFRWFFDFYFNFLYYRPVSRGDIILMDEPALNLHVRSQRELTKILRDYAYKNDITIVISTHSPFMVDLDYLDEVRLVTRNKYGITRIIDDFQEATKNSEEPMDDQDSLKPILSALTIERHTLVNPNEKLFFVEGVTDYLILNALKGKYGAENFHFLPIEGLGSTHDDERRMKIIASLKEIDTAPVLITDGDFAGSQISFAEEHGVRVISLENIKDGVEYIEKMFPDDEYDTILKRKEMNNYCIFRHHIEDIYNDLSEETKENFGILFDILKKDIQLNVKYGNPIAVLFRGMIERLLKGTTGSMITVDKVQSLADELIVVLKIGRDETTDVLYSPQRREWLLKFRHPLDSILDLMDRLEDIIDRLREAYDFFPLLEKEQI